MRVHELVTEAAAILSERGHQIRLRRNRDGAHVPLFRYLATGTCVHCGLSVNVDSSPPTINANVPHGSRIQLHPNIYGDALDNFCTGEKVETPRKKCRLQKMTPKQMKAHKYFLRMALSR